MRRLPRLHRSITRPKSIRPARCVTRPFTAPTPTGCSSNRKHKGDEMNRKLHIPGMWPSRLLLVGMGLFGLTLFAQTPTDPPAPAEQAQQDQKPAATAAAKTEDKEYRQPELG